MEPNKQIYIFKKLSQCKPLKKHFFHLYVCTLLPSEHRLHNLNSYQGIMSYGFTMPLSLFHSLQYRISGAKPYHFIEKLFSVYSKMKPLLVSVVGAVFPLTIMYSLENSDWFDFYAKIFIQKKKHISWKILIKFTGKKKFTHVFVFLVFLLFHAKELYIW